MAMAVTQPAFVVILSPTGMRRLDRYFCRYVCNPSESIAGMQPACAKIRNRQEHRQKDAYATKLADAGDRYRQDVITRGVKVESSLARRLGRVDTSHRIWWSDLEQIYGGLRQHHRGTMQRGEYLFHSTSQGDLINVGSYCGCGSRRFSVERYLRRRQSVRCIEGAGNVARR